MSPSPHLSFLHAKQRLKDQNYKSLWIPALIYGFCMQNRDFRTRITSLYGSQPSSDVLCIHNSDILTLINSLYGSQTSPVVFCMQNSVVSTRITSLDGSQTSPVVLCIQNNVISIRITSLYRSRPSSVVFAFKTAPLGQELQFSIGPRPHLFCFFFAFKTASLAPELQVSMGPRPHLWFLNAKQRLLVQNYQSVWVSDLTCRFVQAKQRD